jgi:NAD(P)-dependent dehydrogenase (short-subunit alcohol dehydrogenase family)
MALNPRVANWRGRIVWLVGASTGIGRATAELLHAQGATVIVSARNLRELEAFATAHPGAEALPLDVAAPGALRDAVAAIAERHGRIDLVAYCAGTYRPMRAADFDLGTALQHLQVNYEGALRLLDAVLPQLRQQAAAGQGGHLSLMASVAGYRGLPKALAYGPTKAALINLAELLYIDLAPLGLGVSVINPGFVQTPLTAQNDFRMPALLTPPQAAEAVLRGWASGAFEIHFPKRFTALMKLLGLLPDRLYFALMRRGVAAQP